MTRTRALIIGTCLLTTAVTAHAATDYVFAINAETQALVAIDAITGAAAGSLPTPDAASGGPDGLAISATSLFFVNGIGSNVIHEVRRNDGAVLASWVAPQLAGGTDGLAHDAGVLFSLDAAARTVFRLDAATGDVLGSCSPGIGIAGGLAAESGRLFSLVGLMTIAELDPTTCDVIAGPFPAPNGEFLLGLAFDGELLYAAAFQSQAIYVLDPDDASVRRTLQPGFMASGLAATSEGAAAPVAARLDVRPGNCVNPLNPRAQGVVPVALVGHDGFDVGQVDLDSLSLGGVVLRHAPRFADVADAEDCSRDFDGVLDVLLKIPAQALAEAMTDGESLQLSGSMLDGRPFVAEDSVTMVGQADSGAPAARAKKR